MFYDKDLMCSKSLRAAWRVGHGLVEEVDGDVTMPNICDKLDSWVASTHEEPHRRLSLRTAAILVDGAARMYKRRLELLFEDTQQLEKDVTSRKRLRGLIDSDNNISQTFTEFQYTTTNSDLTVSIGTGVDDTIETDTNVINTDDTSSNTVPASSNDSHNFQPIYTVTDGKIDKAVQTSPKKRNKCRKHNDRHTGSFGLNLPRISSFNENLPNVGSFDENLPFGLVLIHDNYNSRIPSKVIFSSLNPDISKIM